SWLRVTWVHSSKLRALLVAEARISFNPRRVNGRGLAGPAGLGELEQGLAKPFRALVFPGRVGHRDGGLGRRPRGGAGACCDRAGHEFQPRDRAPAEIGVDSLAQRAALVLQEDGRARLRPQGEHAPGRPLAQLERTGEAGGLRGRGLVPAPDQGGGAEAGPVARALAHGPRVVGQRFRAAPPRGQRQFGLFVLAPLRHGPIMPPKTPAQKLLAWYDVHARVLPWRARKGERADPYRVWLSEIMLQQTTVPAGAGCSRKFLERWPTVSHLAGAPLDDVLAAWAGLGYYARARNLHKAALVVAGELGGRFPDSYEGLRALPGVGDYTAG